MNQEKQMMITLKVFFRRKGEVALRSENFYQGQFTEIQKLMHEIADHWFFIGIEP